PCFTRTSRAPPSATWPPTCRPSPTPTTRSRCGNCSPGPAARWRGGIDLGSGEWLLGGSLSGGSETCAGLRAAAKQEATFLSRSGPFRYACPCSLHLAPADKYFTSRNGVFLLIPPRCLNLAPCLPSRLPVQLRLHLPGENPWSQ